MEQKKQESIDPKDMTLEEGIEHFDKLITFATENYGDTEIRDAIMDKAAFYLAREKVEQAKKVYLEAFEKTVGVSKRLEIYMILLQILFEEGNLEQIKKYIQKCKNLLEEGGDWERRNKLKVYEGLYCLITRDFATAGQLFVSSLSTFSSPEIMSFEKMCFYTVISGLMTLSRQEIKEKVIDNSEVLTVVRENKHLERLLGSFYGCKYKEFFVAFGKN